MPRQRTQREVPKVFTVKAGRQIYRNELPFISIGREGDTHPVEADEITHIIAQCLNKLAHEGR